MHNGNVRERLFATLQASFPDHPGEFTADLQTENIAGWDSVAHVGLMVTLEEEFCIQFEDEEFVAFKTVEELLSIISKKV